MASTPPMQMMDSPQTPQTPLHGATYDHEESPRRTSARLRQKRARDDSSNQASVQTHQFSRTPKSPRTTFELHSPNQTPQSKSNGKRVQIMSPTSPNSDLSVINPTNARLHGRDQYLSTHTILNEGMLPTPVKTPNKRHKMVDKSNIAARALFQDQLAATEILPSPRRNRKGKRYNGFSLESFRTEIGETQTGIQIFTDSRDQVPEKIRDHENPFVEAESKVATSKQVSGTAKRRKISEETKMDPQVEEAIRDDEGMVYVFRGRKVYRRFDDTGEEEEEIDAHDLGLLEYAQDGEKVIKQLKTLTRKSIRPTRLFQTEQQKRARELEKEEEATTDVDDTNHEEMNGSSKLNAHNHPPQSGRRGKSKAKANQPELVAEHSEVKATKKKGSPFDSWVRIKPGSVASASSSRPSRGRKRAASESLDEILTANS